MQDAGNITVNINSNGGDVFSGIAIYNMLKNTLRISPLISMVLLLL
nr:ATP-dependent Clp protease proteolytic subunit [Staphylococcus auricularis]